MSSTTLSKPGTLVHARGREWVVLPESTDELLMLRPVGGLNEEVTGVLPAIETVESATFPLPTRDDIGDFTSGRLLREAARLSTRSAAGPFRSFGRIAVEPRPYQLVPLIMALKLDPIRLLIADDVGIGKTIEAAVIAREMLDRGEIKNLTVLCPPHLAEQWQRELAEKFHIEAELILSSTIKRLERDLPVGVSVFDRHPFTIVSYDFIKTRGRADDFVLKCPELVIVDEAHGCTLSGGVGRGRQQRFELISNLAKDENRHLVLVTATPHSGNEEAFRSLLSLLDNDFAKLPTDLDRAERDGVRRKLARHMVQRRRADIRHFLETDTSFPTRLDKESTYAFDPEYRKLFDDIWGFACDYVLDGDDGQRHRRVRYWSALALLRCVSSSPAAAAATLRSRADVDQTESDIDEIGRRTVLDQDEADDAVIVDFNPGADNESVTDGVRRKMLEFARRADAFPAESDTKLQGAIKEIKELLKKGFQPVVFCRFIDTAEYVASHLRDSFPDRVKIESVTGLLPPAERETRIASLASEGGQYVLVCTDCLSEGINLQEKFNAVLHYDMAWNPTRHEQREGRVDRFGQEKSEVRVVTYYGTDNPIDGVILEVLIRKHKSIKSALGVTVAIPGSSEQIAEALFEGALFRESATPSSPQMTMDFIDDLDSKKEEIHKEWDNAREREKASRSRFAQHTLSPKAVAEELESVRSAIGHSKDVADFFHRVLPLASAPIETQKDSITVHLSADVPRSFRQAIGRDNSFKGRFDLPVEDKEVYLGRTSPMVEGIAGWVLDQALDPEARENSPVAARLGVISTSAVMARTTLVIARFRFQLQVGRGGSDNILCEEIVPLAYTGSLDNPDWLSSEKGEELLKGRPEKNLVDTIINQQTDLLLKALPSIRESLGSVANERSKVQLKAHERVRESARTRGRVSIQPVLPVDILGAYVLLKKLD
jgi:superfamily II DNA or RNA helicase